MYFGLSIVRTGAIRDAYGRLQSPMGFLSGGSIVPDGVFGLEYR